MARRTRSPTSASVRTEAESQRPQRTAAERAPQRPDVDEGEGPIRIPDRRYFRIGEVAELLDVKPHVLRYWETEFREVRPQKSRRNQRLYRRRDVEILVAVRKLLYESRYTIAGARERLRELLADGQLEMFTAPKVPLDVLETHRLESLRDGLVGLLELLDRRESDLAPGD